MSRHLALVRVHPALEETQQYLRDEYAEIRHHVLNQAQDRLDDMQHDLDRMRQDLNAWHART